MNLFIVSCTYKTYKYLHINNIYTHNYHLYARETDVYFGTHRLYIYAVLLRYL